jgi:hypothetical protein
MKIVFDLEPSTDADTALAALKVSANVIHVPWPLVNVDWIAVVVVKT